MTSGITSWLMAVTLFLFPQTGLRQTDASTILRLQAKAYPSSGNNNEEAIRLSESVRFNKGIIIAKRKIGFACGQSGLSMYLEFETGA